MPCMLLDRQKLLKCYFSSASGNLVSDTHSTISGDLDSFS